MIENSAMFKLPCGLYVLSAKDNKDNGCIINTVMQITADPLMISVAVNRHHMTHHMIDTTGVLNVSALTEKAPGELYSTFGFHSGKKIDKFLGRKDVARSQNGLYYFTEHANMYLSARVVKKESFISHTVFYAEVTEAVNLSSDATVTYDFYQKYKKPQVAIGSQDKGYICNVCGYIYEGETLPEEYICPVCHHGVEVFSKMKS